MRIGMEKDNMRKGMGVEKRKAVEAEIKVNMKKTEVQK